MQRKKLTMSKRLVIIGASGHGKVIADIAKKSKYQEVVFLDDNESLTECAGCKVVGTSNDVLRFSDCDFIVAIGNSKIRKKVLQKLIEKELNIATLIHPNAVIDESAQIGVGTVVMAGAVINAEVQIGKGVIINTCSSVDHDCKIGDYVHVSVGSHICGTVIVNDNTWIGAGSTVINNVSICEDCMIGIGTAVIDNIEEKGTYVGVPARKIK